MILPQRARFAKILGASLTGRVIRGWLTADGSDPPMMDVLGIKAFEAQYIVDPHLGVEVKENDTSHLRKLVERHRDRKAGAA